MRTLTPSTCANDGPTQKLLAVPGSGTHDCRVASPSDHCRTEDQAVEITLALFLGVLACVVVVLVSWLLRLVVGTDGGPVWTFVTAIAAPAVGLIVVFRQLFRAGL